MSIVGYRVLVLEYNFHALNDWLAAHVRAAD